MTRRFTLIFCLGALLVWTGCRTSAPKPAHTPRPTYVLVHGAWGGSWDWQDVANDLSADGGRVYRVSLTGQGERSHLTSTNVDLATHIQDVVNTILWDNLHEVVLVGHSYGGMVITGVADRVPDRIRRVVYLDAMLPENGESVMTAMPSRRLPLQIQDGYIIPFWVPTNAPPPHDVPMPERCFTQPITLPHGATIPGFYVLTSEAGKPLEKDDFYKFYLRAQARGWPVRILTGDHNLQRSHPEETARLIEAAAALPSSGH